MIQVQTDIIDSRCVWAGLNNEYRYVLHRLWDKKKPKIVFIGLNPSVADERIDDNTVRKCITIARRDGFGEMVMLNAYGYRSTDPSALKNLMDPNGDLNDYHISEQCRAASKVVVAWGNHATDQRHQLLLNLLGEQELWCFAQNKNGKPKHPLYISNKAPLILYSQP
jgi:hypothetical protein